MRACMFCLCSRKCFYCGKNGGLLLQALHAAYFGAVFQEQHGGKSVHVPTLFKLRVFVKSTV